MDYSVGGEGCGGGGVVIDDLEGGCSSDVESGGVITNKVQVSAHGLIVQVAEVL